ncbi:MAG: AMP-binding protein [Thermoleophilaceae bacterium]
MDGRTLLHRWEAAAALLLANSPTPRAHLHWVKVLPIWLRWRNHPVGALVAGAARYPGRTAVVDDDGETTFEQLDGDTNALARAWRRMGYGPETTIAVLALPSRTFLTATIAAQKLGAPLVYLNAAFAAPQVADVIEDEGIDLLVHDDQSAGATADVRSAMVAGERDLEAAIASSEPRPLRPPDTPGRTVVLTSGTTGQPMGARRAGAGNPLDAAGVLASLPLVSGDRIAVAAPLFHGFGLFGATAGLALGNTLVVRRKFDPEQTLDDISGNRATVLIAVPVMLQRILALPDRARAAYDTSSLRVVASGGSALSAEFARRFMDEFGDILYNIYGSTEVGFATCASPRDLRAVPGTAGRPIPGSIVRLLDQAGTHVPTGATGRIFVGSGLRMDAYTGGGGKEVIGNLVSTGDLGHIDATGRLFVVGRDDEMIVSGGENVFPAEVEEALASHPGILETSVIGVEDAEYGQRLRAFVVPARGAALSEDDVKQHVHERLARFKVPRDVVFLEELPRNATGKVMKKELAEQ